MKPGDVLGRWTVVDATSYRVAVRCLCGSERVVSRAQLRTGATRSCGCLQREVARVHGQAGRLTPEYSAWIGAKARTTNPNTPGWPNYGGRGIRMAEVWLHDFEAFFAHVGPKPGPTYSLDRIDNDLGYEPGNVRWADRSTQRRNRRADHRTRTAA